MRSELQISFVRCADVRQNGLWLSMSLWLLALTTVEAAIAQTSQPAARLAWRRDIAEGVEWAELRHAGNAPVLLVCARNTSLFLLNARTGRLLLWELIRVPGGVKAATELPVAIVAPDQSGERAATSRPGADAPTAPSREHMIYCYSRYSVHAIAVARRGPNGRLQAALKWQVGDAPSQPKLRQADPEFLTRIIAAQAAPNGVLVARSDGRVALLNERDGAPVWTVERGPMSLARWHVDGRTAALIWKAGGEVRAEFFDASGATKPTRSEHKPIGDAWPEWAVLYDGTLFVAWSDRFIARAANGFERAFELKIDSPAKVATFALLHPPGSVAGSQPAAAIPQPGLLYTDISGGVHRVDTATGETVWDMEPANGSKLPWSALRVFGESVLLLREDGWLIVDAAKGKLLGQRYLDPQRDDDLIEQNRFLAVTLHDGFVVVLRSEDRKWTAPWGELLPVGSTRLVEKTALASGEPAKAIPVAAVRLPPIEWLDSFWVRDRLVLTEREGVRSFIIP